MPEHPLRDIRYCQGCGESLAQDAHGGRKWCSERCRRHTLYGGSCVDCGKPTYGGGKRPPERCSPCTNRAATIWTADAIIQTIQAWARENGMPPTAVDWSPNHAIALGHPEKAAKFSEEDAWPHVSTVQERFGSWNAAIRAAGFEPLPPGTYANGRPGEDMGLCREIRARYEAGEGSDALAAEYGCTGRAIQYRVRKAGGQIRTRAAAQTVRFERERAAA